jgi:hypothetical protein
LDWVLFITLPKKQSMRTLLSAILLCLALSQTSAQILKQEYYDLTLYHIVNKAQENAVDQYLKNALLPTLHRAGIKNIGVFKPVETDSTFGKRIYVLIPYKNLTLYSEMNDLIAVDKAYNEAGKEYLSALYNQPPYQRMESILLRTFKGAPALQASPLTGPRSERVYELRSYESATEKIYRNKVNMFVQGDEVGLFKRLGFNAVFYADVLAGSKMPNLMYMTTFANQASRDEHWKAFTDDAQWKSLKGNPIYQNNVSKITIWFLRPTDYSDY